MARRRRRTSATSWPRSIAVRSRSRSVFATSRPSIGGIIFKIAAAPATPGRDLDRRRPAELETDPEAFLRFAFSPGGDIGAAMGLVGNETVDHSSTAFRTIPRLSHLHS